MQEIINLSSLFDHVRGQDIVFMLCKKRIKARSNNSTLLANLVIVFISSYNSKSQFVPTESSVSIKTLFL